MLIAGVVIETLPGKSPDVARRLATYSDIELKGGDGEQRLAAVWRAASGDEFERQIQALLKADADIVGVYPTFAGDDEV